MPLTKRIEVSRLRDQSIQRMREAQAVAETGDYRTAQLIATSVIAEFLTVVGQKKLVEAWLKTMGTVKKE